jgi:flagellar hook-associated protein 3
MTIIGVPSTRVSDLFVRQALLNQIQTDQLAMFESMTQLTTGKQFQYPSENPIAALRVISLQRLLEQKTQVRTNLTTNESFLSATDSAVSQVSSMVSDVRATVLGVMGTTATDTQRAAAAQQVEQALQQLLDTGNQTFRGRYLFAGSQTNVEPFSTDENNIVRYSGDEGRIATLGDVSLIVDSNLQGNEVFGAISDAVCGDVNGNAVISEDTRLCDLFGGKGVALGSVQLTNADTHVSSTVNLSGAKTAGDLMALLKANAPAGVTIDAEITSTGMRVRSTTASLQISDVGSGTTAATLGLATPAGVGTAWIDSKSFDPKALVVPVTFNTRLSDLFNGRGVNKGSIQISNSATGKKTIVDLSCAETVGDIAELIHANPPDGALASQESTLQVEVTPTGLRVRSTTGSLQISDVGTGTIAKELGLTTSTGVGTNWINSADFAPKMVATSNVADLLGYKATAVVRAQGVDNNMIFTAAENGVDMNGSTIQFVDDGSVVKGNERAQWNEGTKTLTVYIQNNSSTAADVKKAVNAANAKQDPAAPCPFTVELDPLDSTYGGKGVLNATTIPSVTTDFGAGVSFDQTSGFRIVNGGSTYTIDISKDKTVQDMLNTLNTSEAGLLAEINDSSTGINVRSRLSGCDFQIGENGGATATQLGLRTFDNASKLSDLNFGRGVADYEGAGVAADATFDFSGENNTLVIQSLTNGPAWNGYKINVTALPTPGVETINWNTTDKTIDIGVNPGQTTVDAIVKLVNSTAGVNSMFRAYAAGTSGSGTVQAASQTTSGGESDSADFSITRNDGVSFEVDIHDAADIKDVLDRINTNATNLGSGTPLVARLAANGNGIELVDNSAGDGVVHTTVTRTKLSTAAIDLGLIPEGATSQSTTTPGAISLAHVVASPAVANSAVLVQARDKGDTLNGTEIRIVDSGAGPADVTYSGGVLTFTIATTAVPTPITTAAQMIQIANAKPALTAEFSFQLDPAQSPNDGSGSLTPTAAADSFVMQGGKPDLLTGSDVNSTETEGLFTALVRLKVALDSNDSYQLERSLQMLDDQMVNTTFARAELGAREQGIDSLQTQNDSQNIEIQSAISTDYDVDLATVISDLAGRQAGYQASLSSMGKIMQMTLLNYL